MNIEPHHLIVYANNFNISDSLNAQKAEEVARENYFISS